MLGRGRTDSGKTVAFALPLVSALAGSRSQARRYLQDQVTHEVDSAASHVCSTTS